MQTQNIQRVTDLEWVNDNPALLKEMHAALSHDKQLSAIGCYVLIFARKGKHVEAQMYLGLMWSYIFFMYPNIDCEVGKNGSSIKLEEMSEEGQLGLDHALSRYSFELRGLLPNLLNEKDPCVGVVRDTAKELLITTHLTRNLEEAKRSFSLLIHSLAGNNLTREMVPELVRESLKDLPKRGGHDLTKNLLNHILVIENRWGGETGEDEILMEIAEVIEIALCRLLDPIITFRVFLTLAKDGLGHQKSASKKS